MKPAAMINAIYSKRSLSDFADATKSGTREAAQNRIDQIEIFGRELARLEAGQVIHLTESQVLAIAAYHREVIRELTARYDVDTSESGRQLSMSMRIVSVIGASLLGSSVFVTFYHFWAAFNVSTQTFLLWAAPASTFLFALFVRAHDRTGYFSRLSAALSYASFVLAVVFCHRCGTPISVAGVRTFLHGFRLHSCVRDALSAAAMRSPRRRPHLQCCADRDIARWPMVGFRGAARKLLSRRSHSIGCRVLFAQHRYVDFGTLYRLFGAATLLGVFLVLASWPSLSYLAYGPHAVSEGYKIGILAAGGSGIYIGVTRQQPEVGFLSSLAILFLIGLEAYDWLLPKLAVYQFFLIMSVLAIGALYVLKVVRGRVTEREARTTQ